MNPCLSGCEKGGQVHRDLFTMRSMPSKSKLNLDLAKGTACVVPASQRRSAHTHRFRACTRAAHRYRLRNVGYCCSNLAGGPTRQQFSVGWAWEKEILWNAENRGIKLRLREQEPSRRQCTLCSSPWSRHSLVRNTRTRRSKKYKSRQSHQMRSHWATWLSLSRRANLEKHIGEEHDAR